MSYKPLFLTRLSLLLSYLLILAVTQANELPYSNGQVSQMVRGGVGLWQVPTARMAANGSLSVNYTDNEEYRFWSASLQLFPWMESTVRYTDARTRLYSDVPSFSGEQTLKDKGIDVKFRLLQENYYLPNIAVGFTDIGGTGWFASEYITASKAIGPFDFHLGLGWGYLGTGDNLSNPFCELSDSYCNRTSGFSGRGGIVEFDKFFTGTTALFGGLEYVTPIEGLRLKLEYEAKNYINDRAGNLQQDSYWNLGAVYQWQDFDFSLNYQRGNTVGFGVSYKFNMHTVSQAKIDSPPRPLFNSQPAASMEELDRNRLYNELYSQGGFSLSATHTTADEMTFYGMQLNYREKDEAIERVGRIIASELPNDIKKYSIVETTGAVPMLETVIDAEKFKSAARLESLENDIKASYFRQDTDIDTLENFKPNRTSGVFYSADSFWIQTFGSPEDFYLYQGGLFLSGGYAFNNFSVVSSVKATLVENFDKFTFKVDNQDTSVPRVRTYAREYVTRSKVTMETAYVSWFDRIAENTYAQAYAGYLESMFGGIGGELLYRPVDSNFAFGVDVNYVQQRSYENDWDFFDYKVLTGHASIYWQPSFLPDTQIIVSAGQFLAKDKGVNIDFAKRFDSGIIVGAYAAFTNVSAEEYGEGSFTKGFYISLPFELFTLEPARGRGKLPWIPIARDGGQKLTRPVELRNITEVRSPFYD
ncbi:polysaccharide biosynthesis protein [Paraglaciecola hydrolytica]|uniref:Polysaccharide biosynthesis protein n=2 Tax=Paraglaciecola hydrolytica TaxID=1799789 RepID=A0A136A512_9ALTE|nr:polysaccharide biosynthesis protein [Paraglaciecola hydrolytica]